MKLILFGGLFFCLLGTGVYFLIFWPGLWIEKIEVSDQEVKQIVEQKLAEKLWYLIPQKSIFLAPINQIKQEILAQFPEIKSVMIDKKAPRLLIIEITKREKIGIWCQCQSEETASSTPQRKINQCFQIDQEGIIFRPSPIITGSLILNIYSSQEDLAEIRDQVVSPEIIEFILKINNALKSSLKPAGFETISLEDLRMSTEQGWQIYFNPSYSAESQLRALDTILEKEIKEAVNSLEYIDLRIQGRAYYRFKE